MENESLEVKTTEIKSAKQKLTPVLSLLESSISIWWKNIKKFVGIYVWAIYYALIPLFVIFLIIMLADRVNFNWEDKFFSIYVVAMVLACFLVFLYFAIRSYIGMFLLVKKDYQGNTKEIFKETKKYFWSYLWLSVLTTIFILLWTCLLIIPGIIFSVFYSFAVYAFFFEDLKGMKAIKRSVSLVKNYWWLVAGRFIVIGIVLWVFMMIISIPLYLADKNSLFSSIWASAIQVINFLIVPIALLFSYQIYKDLVKIKS